MKKLPLDAQSKELYNFCREWLVLLEQRDFTQAADMLYNSGEFEEITPKMLEEALGSDRNITDWRTACGDNPRDGMEAFEEEEIGLKVEVDPVLPIQINWHGERNPERPTAVGSLCLYYPIDGEWSSRSSDFVIHLLSDCIALEILTLAE